MRVGIFVVVEVDPILGFHPRQLAFDWDNEADYFARRLKKPPRSARPKQEETCPPARFTGKNAEEFIGCGSFRLGLGLSSVLLAICSIL